MTSDYSVIFCEIASLPEAERLVSALGARKLIASASISPVQRYHLMETGLEQVEAAEVRLITRLSLFDDIREQVLQYQPDVSQELLAVPVIHAAHQYLDWIDDKVYAD